MAVFPSKEWVEAVLEAANQNRDKEAAKGWHGDFLCTIEGDEELLRELNRREVVKGFMSLMAMMQMSSEKSFMEPI